ncbi:outer membrane beta-barrel protein [Prevotella sp. 10(H)]|uniref:outer membrane beta-barrel protein n=1 Tax=Prevotella sp. 10(H) TaxID=1158294 RepID=UPI0004A73407|nr:outer membrane beta-barrel protein [Prevotella sp. 10(H)]
MKKLLLFVILFLLAVYGLAQEGHKLNLDIDASFNLNYAFSNKDGIKDPVAVGASLGYEYDVNMFFGIEAGFRGGGFNQGIRYYDPNFGLDPMGDPQSFTKTTYKGTYWAPYIAPKLYLPIGYDDKKDRARYVFIENRLSYMRINLNKAEGMTGNAHKYRLTYEIRAGYQFPIDDRWAMSCWLGYNTFDFSKVKPEVVQHKNSTPIQVGIGFNYIIKQ